jgi:hypothetical protein
MADSRLLRWVKKWHGVGLPFSFARASAIVPQIRHLISASGTFDPKTDQGRGLPRVPFDSKTTISLFRSRLAMRLKKWRTRRLD